MTQAEKLIVLAERCETATQTSNALDVEIEIALFEPDDEFSSIRANAAGTKTICATVSGSECTFWAQDYTLTPTARRDAAAALRARAAMIGEG